MAKIKLYHGTSQETTPFTMYFSANLSEAKEFALGLNDCGEYNDESFIYTTEIDDDDISVENDFEIFDSLAYFNSELNGYSNVVYNPESGWYIVKNPVITLEEHFINNL